MGVAADLTEASWPVFNRLLDAALELPPGERLSWLEALGPEHERLKPALRALLLRSGGVETAWLATLPRGDAALPAVDESDLAAGAVVGPYRLLRELGVGGMGAVWLAERADGSLKRQVALKLPRTSWTRGLAERLARERDILAALEHPHIARLYDAGTDAQGRPFLALEYVEGQPIDVYCRERSLNTKARLALLLQVAQAVAFAHSRLVIHRDLQPSNILVTADGAVRLLDFGIAKLMEGDRTEETQLTQLAGRALTLDYASP
jgi:serine/threonine-protein kinase